MWVQAWNIPVQWLTSETVWKIGKIFNKFLNVVIHENGSKKGRYVKILVEVDLSKPQIRGTKVRFEGETCWVNFKYELLPFFCCHCGRIGHGKKVCEMKMLDVGQNVLKEGQFREWLKATNGRFGNTRQNIGMKFVSSPKLRGEEEVEVVGKGREENDRSGESDSKQAGGEISSK